MTAKPDILICPVFKTKEISKEYSVSIKKLLADLEKNELFKGKEGEMEVVHTLAIDTPKRICFLGMGKEDEITSEKVRNLVAGAAKKVKSLKAKHVSFLQTEGLNEFIQEAVEAITLVNYNPAKYKTGKAAKKISEGMFSDLRVIAKKTDNSTKDNIKKGYLLAQAVHNVRDLVNGPANMVTVSKFAQIAKNIAKEHKYKITVFDKTKLEKMNMGGILCVNSGSGKKGAKLIVMEHNPRGLTEKEKKHPILLVGKGLIFDTGGYNLKPSRYIEDMQQDKAGGAVVLGVFNILKALNIKKRVIGIVPVTENLIDAEAFKPADVIKTYAGKTVEIRNTDAEGRMILIDALAYGIKKYKPEFTIDLATLTGSCVVALGDRYAGIMGNDKTLIEYLIQAGQETDELVWELPIHKDFTKSMKGKVADLRNVDNGTSHLAGASKAGAFLQNFVGKSKWVHVDIAGTAYNEKPKPYDQPMATGYGVRLIARFLENLCE